VIWPVLPSLDKILRSIWIATSAGLLLFYGLSWTRLRNAQRCWRRETLNGQEVWVTSNPGPAVFGYITPRVLMPQWAFDAPATSRALILSHELEHIAARDPWLLLLALAIVAAAPWSPPLWWQLRRLRFAIEVDCDARVLSRGADVGTYGEVLLAVGQQGSLGRSSFNHSVWNLCDADPFHRRCDIRAIGTARRHSAGSRRAATALGGTAAGISPPVVRVQYFVHYHNQKVLFASPMLRGLVLELAAEHPQLGDAMRADPKWRRLWRPTIGGFFARYLQ
jgi:hypothetical protein